MKVKGQNWVLAGQCAVDAGLIMIGDPCYINGEEPANELATGDWMEFCDWLGEDYPITKEIPFRLGHDGAGVVMSSGLGDGCYEVWVRVEEIPDWGKRVVEARIIFLHEDELKSFKHPYER